MMSHQSNMITQVSLNNNDRYKSKFLNPEDDKFVINSE
jgi:hypothetical protein